MPVPPRKRMGGYACMRMRIRPSVFLWTSCHGRVCDATEGCGWPAIRVIGSERARRMARKETAPWRMTAS